MDGLLGVAGIIIESSYGSFPHSLLSTSKMITDYWLVVSTPLKNMKVSWDDDIPNWMESPKIHVPNHQPDNIMETYYPLAICYIAIEHGHRNSWFTIKNGGCVHSFLYVYQRVLVSFPWTLCWSYTVYIYICPVYTYMAVCQNLVPLVNIKIAGSSP